MKKDDKNNSGIFREIFVPEGNGSKIEETIENLISMTSDSKDAHILIKNGEFENLVSERNEISNLVKNAYRLPETDFALKMLTGEEKIQEDKKEDESEKDPYRMVNLISGSFRLPEIDDENFLR